MLFSRNNDIHDVHRPSVGNLPYLQVCKEELIRQRNRISFLLIYLCVLMGIMAAFNSGLNVRVPNKYMQCKLIIKNNGRGIELRVGWHLKGITKDLTVWPLSTYKLGHLPNHPPLDLTHTFTAHPLPLTHSVGDLPSKKLVTKPALD